MAITELALLRLKTPKDPTVWPALRSAIQAQATYSTFPVYLLTQIEDPSYVYLLGGWESTATHLNDWIPGETNQRLMAALQDHIEVDWMIHIDIDPRQFGGNVLTSSRAQERILLDAPVMAIGRYFLATGRRDAFLRTFYATKGNLQASIAPRTLQGGLRLEPRDTTVDGEEKQEFVLFSEWDDVPADSAGFEGLGRAQEALAGTEIKHARIWERTDQ